MSYEQVIQAIKPVADPVSVIIAGGTISTWFFDYGIPGGTAVLAFAWMGIRIWETETVKRLTNRWED